MEQRQYTPFEVEDEVLAIPSPSDLLAEMTIYLEGQATFPDWVTTALETLESQILHDWENTLEEFPSIRLEVVKKETNFTRVKI